MAKIIFAQEKATSSPQYSDTQRPVSPYPTWLQALTPQVRELVEDSLGAGLKDIEEIRLRIERPLIFRIGCQELTVDGDKKLTQKLRDGYITTRQELERTLHILSQNSLYAWEDQMRNGFITIPGGHRVGIVGRGVLDKGRIKTLKDISGLNYRVGREVLGCSGAILPFLINDNRVMNCLVVSPPQCGKTTLLRDIIRQVSHGIRSLNFPGVNVGLVDERSEIAGMYLGQPQFDIGLRTDVLDACPKAEGMMMMIRAMSPVVIATDEIGRKDDLEALYHALQSGVSVIATVHGSSFEEIKDRPVLAELLQGRFFQRLVFLSRKKGPGTLEAVLDGRTLERMG